MTEREFDSEHSTPGRELLGWIEEAVYLQEKGKLTREKAVMINENILALTAQMRSGASQVCIMKLQFDDLTLWERAEVSYEFYNSLTPQELIIFHVLAGRRGQYIALPEILMRIGKDPHGRREAHNLEKDLETIDAKLQQYEQREFGCMNISFQNRNTTAWRLPLRS